VLTDEQASALQQTVRRINRLLLAFALFGRR
jgi:hypothetical protein